MPDTYPEDLVFAAKGTGRTTGHIVTLSIQNPTSNDLVLEIPALLIPSSGKYQPYIVPSPTVVEVPARSTTTVDVEGYCVDIHAPPVPSGENMPSVSSWIGKDPSLFDDNGIISDKLTEYWGVTAPNQDDGVPSHPVIRIFPADTTIRHPVVTNHIPSIMVSNNGREREAVIQQFTWYYSVNPPNHSEFPIIPVTSGDEDEYDPMTDFGTVIKDTINQTPPGQTQQIQQILWYYSVQIPKDSIMLTAPLLFDAIDKIINTTDSLKAAGAIATPFSGNPPKERESVIQQTFWYYTAALHDEEYTKEDFQVKLEEQYEEATGQSVSSAPAQVQTQIQGGVDDFWNTFQLVGAEAKVLSDGSMMANRKAERRGDVVLENIISVQNPDNTDKLIEE